MGKNRITQLRERYEAAKKQRKEPYFDADEIDDLLNSIEESDDDLLYDELLDLGLRLHPGNTTLRIRHCRQLLFDGQIDEALILVEQIGEKGNQDVDIMEIECYAMMENYSKVIELTEELIAKKADYLSLVFEYIIPVLNEVELYTEAIDYADRGLLLFPHSVVIKEELYFALEQTEQFDRAIVICNELIDQKPYSFDEWFALGRFYAYKGDFDHAIEAFDFALTCDDTVDDLKLLLAYCLSRNENYTRAIAICQELVDDSLLQKHAVYLIVECYTQMKDTQAGYTFLKDYIGTLDNDFYNGLYIQLASCCVEMNRMDEACEILFEAHKKSPHDIEILFMLSFLTKNEEKKSYYLDKLDQIGKQAREQALYADPKAAIRMLAKDFLEDKGNSN